MARSLSAQDAERLLDGEVGPDDVSGAPEVARLLANMREFPAVDERNGAPAAVAGIAAAIRAADGTEPVPISRGRSRRTSAKVTVVAFAAVLASGTAAAAAANGSLPPTVQRAVSNALAHVHVSVPKPPKSPARHPRVPGSGLPSSTGERAPVLGTGSLPPEGAQGPRGSVGNGNSTRTTPNVPGTGNGNGVGNGKTTTRTLPEPANGKGNGLGNGNGAAGVTTTTTAKTNNGNSSHTLPPQAGGNGNGNGNGAVNGNGNGTTPTTHTLPPQAGGNGNGNGKTPPGQTKKTS